MAFPVFSAWDGVQSLLGSKLAALLAIPWPQVADAELLPAIMAGVTDPHDHAFLGGSGLGQDDSTGRHQVRLHLFLYW
jgi:hypothetical protein